MYKHVKRVSIALVLSLIMIVNVTNVAASNITQTRGDPTISRQGTTIISPNTLVIQWEDGSRPQATINTFRFHGYNVAQLRTMVEVLDGIVSNLDDGSFQMSLSGNSVNHENIVFNHARDIEYIINDTSIRNHEGELIFPNHPGWVFLPEFDYNWSSLRDVVSSLGLMVTEVIDDPVNATTEVTVNYSELSSERGATEPPPTQTRRESSTTLRQEDPSAPPSGTTEGTNRPAHPGPSPDGNDDTETDQPGTGDTETDQPGADDTETDQLGAGDTETDQPGTGDTEADQPGTGDIEADQPGTGDIEADQPDAGDTEADQPDAGDTEADQPDAGDTEADQPGDGDTEADQPGDGDTEADQPGDGDTEADQPDNGDTEKDSTEIEEPEAEDVSKTVNGQPITEWADENGLDMQEFINGLDFKAVNINSDDVHKGQLDDSGIIVFTPSLVSGETYEVVETITGTFNHFPVPARQIVEVASNGEIITRNTYVSDVLLGMEIDTDFGETTYNAVGPFQLPEMWHNELDGQTYYEQLLNMGAEWIWDIDNTHELGTSGGTFKTELNVFVENNITVPFYFAASNAALVYVNGELAAWTEEAFENRESELPQVWHDDLLREFNYDAFDGGWENNWAHAYVKDIDLNAGSNTIIILAANSAWTPTMPNREFNDNNNPAGVIFGFEIPSTTFNNRLPGEFDSVALPPGQIIKTVDGQPIAEWARANGFFMQELIDGFTFEATRDGSVEAIGRLNRRGVIEFNPSLDVDVEYEIVETSDSLRTYFPVPATQTVILSNVPFQIETTNVYVSDETYGTLVRASGAFVLPNAWWERLRPEIDHLYYMGARWIWDRPDTFVLGSTRGAFETRITVNVEDDIRVPFYFAADNAALVFVNGTLVSNTTNVFRDNPDAATEYEEWRNTLLQEFFHDHGARYWYRQWEHTYEQLINLKEGSNEIIIIAANAIFSRSDQNPAGLVFGFELPSTTFNSRYRAETNSHAPGDNAVSDIVTLAEDFILDNELVPDDELTIDSEATPDDELTIDNEPTPDGELIIDSGLTPDDELIIDSEATPDGELIIDSKLTPDDELITDREATLDGELIIDSAYPQMMNLSWTASHLMTSLVQISSLS